MDQEQKVDELIESIRKLLELMLERPDAPLETRQKCLWAALGALGCVEDYRARKIVTDKEI